MSIVLLVYIKFLLLQISNLMLRMSNFLEERWNELLKDELE